MPHRLFYTDYDVPETEYRASKARLTAFLYNELDDALGKARQIEGYGGVAWEIESENGPVLGRREIAHLLRVRASELVGRPRVY